MTNEEGPVPPGRFPDGSLTGFCSTRARFQRRRPGRPERFRFIICPRTEDPDFLTVEMQDFRQLKVWQKSHALRLAVYRATASFPRAELGGLTSQLRRASVSIASNIAEGCGRGSDADFRRFLLQAMGSASEVQDELLLARDLEYLARESYEVLERDVVEVKRMLAALVGKLGPG